MNTTIRCAFLVLLVCFLVAGCGKADAPGKLCELKGKFTSITVRKKSVTLDHESVPDLLEAKKRNFNVETAEILRHRSR